MLLVEPVVIRPLLVEWVAEKTAIAAELDRAEAAKSSAARTKRRNEAERRLRAFLERLRRFTVLDPACGSGNFLYLALQALKDLEHRGTARGRGAGLPARVPGGRPGQRQGHRAQPHTRRSWRACRCGSARSSGCAATVSRKRATRS